jgi:transketolase
MAVTQQTSQQITKNINELKKIILELAYNTKEGHIASSFGIMDILYILYDNVMNHDIDRFVLSKGHSSLALYVILYHNGFVTKEQLYSFCKYDSELGGHPKLNPQLGIYASTGSLGHGFPIAVGMALAKKIKGEDGNIYCLIGDGEANEGTIYESLLLASHHKLNNLCLILDNNQSIDKALSLGSFEQKAQSFGWNVESIVGHNHYDIENSFNIMKNTNKPLCIVAYTLKGHGIQRIENNSQEWHHKFPNEKEYGQMLEELSL